MNRDYKMRDTSRILHIHRYLQEKSDEHHPLTTKQILEHLESQGITASRRTIPGDIETLTAHGIDIITIKSTQNLYYIGERHFEMPELRLLIDAVRSSKFITPKKSKILTDKLHKLISEHQKSELADGMYFPDVKPLNEEIYRTEETIRTAIGQHKQVTFKYYEYLAANIPRLRSAFCCNQR